MNPHWEPNSLVPQEKVDRFGSEESQSVYKPVTRSSSKSLLQQENVTIANVEVNQVEKEKQPISVVMVKKELVPETEEKYTERELRRQKYCNKKEAIVCKRNSALDYQNANNGNRTNGHFEISTRSEDLIIDEVSSRDINNTFNAKTEVMDEENTRITNSPSKVETMTRKRRKGRKDNKRRGMLGEENRLLIGTIKIEQDNGDEVSCLSPSMKKRTSKTPDISSDRRLRSEKRQKVEIHSASTTNRERKKTKPQYVKRGKPSCRKDNHEVRRDKKKKGKIVKIKGENRKTTTGSVTRSQPDNKQEKKRIFGKKLAINIQQLIAEKRTRKNAFIPLQAEEFSERRYSRSCRKQRFSENYKEGSKIQDELMERKRPTQFEEVRSSPLANRLESTSVPRQSVPRQVKGRCNIVEEMGIQSSEVEGNPGSERNTRQKRGLLNGKDQPVTTGGKEILTRVRIPNHSYRLIFGQIKLTQIKNCHPSL